MVFCSIYTTMAITILVALWLKQEISTMPAKQSSPKLRYIEGPPWKIVVDDIGVLRRALGEQLLASFARCLAASERLLTIDDCILLNDQYPKDSIRRNRNIMTLGLFSVGLVHEFREGLEALEKSGLGKQLTADGQAKLQELLQFKNFEHESSISQLRNTVAFHLGEQRVALRGLRRLSNDAREIVVASGDGQIAGECRYDFAMEIMMAGINARPVGIPKNTLDSNKRLTTEEITGAIHEARNAHNAALQLLDGIFVDLLQQVGATTAT
jgi:hypothetical protein